jgi:hypothetical protein
MALRDELGALRDRVLAEIDAVYDYYNDTKIAWQIVHQWTASGRSFAVRNLVTGTITTEADLAAKARGYVAEQLAEATFQQLISTFENFLFDFLRLWLLAYPQSLGKRTISFSEVLDAADFDAIAQTVIDRELLGVMYKPPAGWFDYLHAKVSLRVPSADEIGKIAEAKATRDMLVHNRGYANKAYMAKAANHARYNAGERVYVSEDYHIEIWRLIRKVVTDICQEAMAKLSQ